MDLVNTVFADAIKELMDEAEVEFKPIPPAKPKSQPLKNIPPIEVPERQYDPKWDAFATFITYILRQYVLKIKSPESAADALIHCFLNPESIKE
jgi:hypothetical protein